MGVSANLNHNIENKTEYVSIDKEFTEQIACSKCLLKII